MSAAPAALTPDNPFTAASELPYQLPPFDRIRDEHFLPAFEAGFAQQLAEIEAITGQAETPSFENTIEALERSGQLLDRVGSVFWSLASANATEHIEQLERELSPRVAEHADSIRLNGALYARIRQLWEQVDGLGLDAEQRHVLERTELAYRLRGAGLDAAGKERLAAINRRLAELSTTFQQHLLADTNARALLVDAREQLAGLDDSEIDAAAAAAQQAGHAGRFRISLVLFTSHPYLSRLHDREVRRRLFEASTAKASAGDANDNSATVLETVRLRAERAELLGFPNHAAVVTAEATAGSPQAVEERLRLLAEPAARNARAEQELLQALIDAQQAERGEQSFALEPWDWPYYAEQLRARDYDLDLGALRPWFEAERVLRDGVFWAANRLFGVTFTERPELPAYHPEVRVFEVRDADGGEVGLFLLDLYARAEKRGGAWMNSLVQQNRLLGQPTVVTNTLNVPHPAEGAPTLLSFDEVTTLFHEFGHALHGLFALVGYPSSAGTSVPRDFVEFPSQVNEVWLSWPEVIAHYTAHVERGEPLPTEVIERLQAAERFNQGFATTEYLAASVIDFAWHSLSAAEAASVDDIAAFERAALERFGLAVEAVPPRYRSHYFQHIFAGGYSAGYYSYIWSEVLDADTVEWFREHGGLRRENGQRFRERLLAVGGSRDALDTYRDFRGRDARIEPLLERRGLTPA